MNNDEVLRSESEFGPQNDNENQTTRNREKLFAGPAFENQRGIGSAKAKGIGKCIIHGGFARHVGHVVQIASGIGLLLVDRGRQNLVAQGQYADACFQAARRRRAGARSWISSSSRATSCSRRVRRRAASSRWFRSHRQAAWRCHGHSRSRYHPVKAWRLSRPHASREMRHRHSRRAA